MTIHLNFRKKTLSIFLGLSLVCGGMVFAGQQGKALVLQEMTWADVMEYLKTSDMVIIPMGSTEQHGPHLPLGTDFYSAMAISKEISARTGVVVAPVILAGYSVYHSGFPGTLSLKPETMTAVLFETAEMLIKYGFRRIMFLNYHGGNVLVESTVMHKINHSTEAVAVRIGIGGSFYGPWEEAAPFDHHAGIGETSTMLFLKPELVKLERIQKPAMTFTDRMKQIQALAKENRGMNDVLAALQAVPVETKKGGASHEMSSNGIYTLGDPAKATKERGKRNAEKMVAAAVKFIETWKKVKK